MTMIIESEYQVQSTLFWVPKLIEDWPTDKEGALRDLKTAHNFWIKWGLLHVKWHKDGHVFEYEPTAEDHGDGIDFKWPDAEFIDGERMD